METSAGRLSGHLRPRRRSALILAVVLALTSALSAFAADVTGCVVLFRKGGDGEEITRHTDRDCWFFPFRRGGIPCVTYDLPRSARAVHPELAKDLAKAKLIYFGGGTHTYWDNAPATMFKSKAVREAVKAALAGGAVLFFDYHGIGLHNAKKTGLADLFSEISLPLPPSQDRVGNQYYRPQFTEDDPLLSAYQRVGKHRYRGYGWWRKVPATYKVLARPDLEKAGAAALVARGVAGKGTVVFNQVYSLLRGNTTFADNLAAVVFGREAAEEIKKGGRVSHPESALTRADEGGSGPALPVANTFFPASGPNRLYGANLERLPWTEPDASDRIAFIAYEPSGIKRLHEPVSVLVDLDGADPEGLKVRLPYGTKVPRQVRRVGNGKAEVFFHLALGPYETVGFFLYRGGRKETAGPEFRHAAIRKLNADELLIENDFLRVVIDGWGKLKYMAPRNGTGLNNIAHWGTYVAPGYGNAFEKHWELEHVSTQITEPGPVRVALTSKFKHREKGYLITVRYSLSARSPLLFETTTCDRRATLGRRHRWAPRGDLVNDTVYYAGPKGLRALPMERISYKEYGDILRHMSQGWYVVADDRGECVGEFFDREMMQSIRFAMHGTGIMANETFRVGGDRRLTRALFSLAGDHTDAYPHFLRWKNPPTLLARSWQRRTGALLRSPVPKLGRQPLSMMFLWDNWYRATAGAGDAVERARSLIRDVKYQGCNGVLLCMHGNDLITSEGFNGRTLVDLAHPEGIAVMAAPYTSKYRDLGLKPRGQRICMATDREKLRHFFRGLAGTGVDHISIGDEMGPRFRRDVLERLYMERTGKKWNTSIKNFEKSDTPEKGEHNMFQSGLQVDWAHDMVGTIKALNPNCMVTIITSPNNHNRLNGFQDVERFMEKMDVGCTDLYHRYICESMKYMTAYMRGCAGNGIEASPLLIACCNVDPRNNWSNLNANLLAGNVNLIYYGYGYGRKDRENLDITRRFFHWRTLSGLGRHMMRTSPRALFAVAFDHDAFMDSVLKGEYVSPGSGSIRYNRSVSELFAVKGFRADLIMKRWFRPEILARYEALIVPGGRVAAPGVPQAVRAYAARGGKVLIVGDALRVPAFRDLAGVSVGESRSARLSVRGLRRSLKGYRQTLPGELYTLRRKAGDVKALVESDGGPLVLARPVGRGEVASCLMATGYAELAVKVLADMAGGMPLSFVDSGTGDIEAALFRATDGHVVGLFNPRSGKARDVTFALKKTVRPGRYLVDFRTGAITEHSGGAYRVTLGPEEVGFYLLTDRPPDTAMSEMRHHAERPATYGAVPCTFTRRARRIAPRRRREPGKIYVGVFHSDERTRRGRQLVKGGGVLRDSLSRRHGLVVDLLPDLASRTISSYDVVVVPNTGSPSKPSNLNEDWKSAVRTYVENGGGLLLCHHVCGLSAAFGGPVFPEIADVTGYVPLQNMKIAADHPVASGQAMRDMYPARARDPAFADQFNDTIMKKGDLFGAAYPDYISLRARPDATVVAVSEVEGMRGNDDVIVAGAYGKGKVVLCGLCLGTRLVGSGRNAKEEDHLPKGESNILVNSVYWLGGKQNRGR